MNKVCTSLLAGVFSLAVPATVTWGQMSVGADAPELSVGAWHNLPGGLQKLSLKELKGQVVMIEFWTTW